MQYCPVIKQQDSVILVMKVTVPTTYAEDNINSIFDNLLSLCKFQNSVVRMIIDLFDVGLYVYFFMNLNNNKKQTKSCCETYIRCILACQCIMYC